MKLDDETRAKIGMYASESGDMQPMKRIQFSPQAKNANQRKFPSVQRDLKKHFFNSENFPLYGTYAGTPTHLYNYTYTLARHTHTHHTPHTTHHTPCSTSDHRGPEQRRECSAGESHWQRQEPGAALLHVGMATKHVP